jgi:hypothetical protein
MEQMFERIKDNLFPTARAAIENWEAFPWHRDRHGNIQTWKIGSSQALAIDVFGTIKISGERDRVLGGLAEECGLPADGPWALKLEWTDPDNLLCEPRPTQVDAIAFGQCAILVFECKFTEGGGRCTQPNRIGKGDHRGLRQCNGTYALQVNPVNKKKARCALTGKRVKYWEHIPRIFGLNAERDHRPCPFQGDAYQWMRNIVLADALAFAYDMPSAVIAAYADAPGFATAKKVRAGGLPHQALSGAQLVIPMSIQSIVALAQSLTDDPKTWSGLAAWVERKITSVPACRGPSAVSRRG